MNRIISLFLFIFIASCLNGQYNSPIRNKVTLGKQTSADGLVWRGLRADTTSKIVPFSDTSAYIILDTVEKTLWLYKAGQVPKWQQVGGSTLDTAAMLLPYWRSGRFSGVLPVANGGTGLTTFTAANRIPYSTSATALTTNSNFTYDGNRLTIPEAIFNGTTNYGYIFSAKASTSSGGAGIFIRGTQGSDNTLPTTFGYPYVNIGGVENRLNAIQTIGFGFTNGTGGYLSPAEIGYLTNSTNGFTNGHLVFATRESTSNVAPDEKMRITSDGKVGIGTTSPTYKLDISGTVNTSLLALRSSTNPSSNSYVGIDFGTGNYNGNLPDRSSRILGIVDGTNDQIGLSFYTSNIAAPTEKMRITSDGKVGIGTTTPTARLQVKGSGISTGEAFKIENSIGTNLLTVLDNGSMTLNTPLSVANGGTGATTYGDSTLLQGRGTSAISSSTDLLFNYTTKTLKVNGLYIGLGNSNVSSNIKIGNLATLSKNAAGGNTNTAIGAFALENNTTGDENLAIGSYAMNLNTTGGYSVAIGANTLSKSTIANFNCAIGRSSLQELKTGTKNVVIGGTDAGVYMDSSSNSTIIGTEAGSILNNQLTGGTNNTLLGYRAHSSTGTVSNEITLGNSSIATIRAQVTTITSLSDARDKSDILPLHYGMNFIEKLKPVSFVWNMRDGGKIGISDIGFIAQDLQKAQIDTNVNVPNLVSGTEDKLEAGYGVLLPIIVKALQEANEKIKSLEQRILTLENK